MSSPMLRGPSLTHGPVVPLGGGGGGGGGGGASERHSTESWPGEGTTVRLFAFIQHRPFERVANRQPAVHHFGLRQRAQQCPMSAPAAEPRPAVCGLMSTFLLSLHDAGSAPTRVLDARSRAQPDSIMMMMTLEKSELCACGFAANDAIPSAKVPSPETV